MSARDETSAERATSKDVDLNFGSNGFVREGVTAIQRARLLAAMVDVAAEGGLTSATVGRVVAYAGVSRRTFYELFEDREACFLAAMDDAVAQVSHHIVPVYQSGKGWSERIRLALTAFLWFLESEPSMGKFLIVGSLGAGPNALERRSRALAQIITVVDGGRGEGKAVTAPPPLTAEAIVGAIFSVAHARMVERTRRPLIELVNPLMSMIVLPYLGPAASRGELERPVSKTCAPSRYRPTSDLLRDLGVRLTYRTARVLLAIGDCPGASNKEVGEASGAQDQGQISKLLARLENLGLIRNDGVGPSKGASNAWTLTKRGREVQGAFVAQSSAS
jgi:AcrR family transcriptional regulator